MSFFSELTRFVCRLVRSVSILRRQPRRPEQGQVTKQRNYQFCNPTFHCENSKINSMIMTKSELLGVLLRKKRGGGGLPVLKRKCKSFSIGWGISKEYQRRTVGNSCRTVRWFGDDGFDQFTIAFASFCWRPLIKRRALWDSLTISRSPWPCKCFILLPTISSSPLALHFKWPEIRKVVAWMALGRLYNSY